MLTPGFVTSCIIEEANKVTSLLAFLLFFLNFSLWRQSSSMYEVCLLSCCFVNVSSLHVCTQKKFEFTTTVVLLELSKDPKSYLVFCRLVAPSVMGDLQDEEELLDSRLEYWHI